jgi:hypothetical protein
MTTTTMTMTNQEEAFEFVDVERNLARRQRRLHTTQRPTTATNRVAPPTNTNTLYQIVFGQEVVCILAGVLRDTMNKTPRVRRPKLIESRLVFFLKKNDGRAAANLQWVERYKN